MFLSLALMPAAMQAQTPADSFAVGTDTVAADTLPALHGNWVQQLWQARFQINDPRIHYPKFANFCRKVYNWGDRTFNSYDTAYVVGTGKKWKAIVSSNNWMQGYGYLFDLSNRHSETGNVTLRSNINVDLGVSLNFMAVGVSHTWNVNTWMKGPGTPRSAWRYSFTCALFSAEVTTLSTSGNTIIDRFGKFNEGRKIHYSFDDVRQQSITFQGYYFFNHRKYSQAAAYSFSKYQLRNAGTWLLGVRYSKQDIEMDFGTLPAEMLAFKPEGLPLKPEFRYHEFALAGGYAYNVVMPHHWLFNITATPALGYRRSLMSGQRTFGQMVVTGMTGSFALTYNHRALFLSLQGTGNMSFVFDSNYSFFAAREGINALIGIRF